MKRTLVAVLTAASLSLLASPADAHSLAAEDPAGDVMLNAGADVVGTPTGYVPDRKEGDIRAITVNHQAAKIRVRLKFRDLARELDGKKLGHTFMYRYVAPGVTRRVWVRPDAANPDNRVIVRDANGKRVGCRVTGTIDYTQNTVVLDVPRTCLGTPAWVRVGAAGISSSGQNTWYDDARVRGFREDLVLGPRIAAG